MTELGRVERIGHISEILARTAIQMVAGMCEEGELGRAASDAVVALAGAIVEVATLNTKPRAVLDRVVAMLDTADV